ncbi:DUF1403 family protein [Ancylobacter polymorphus]|uniref:DUF1403 family protein n=1 Tax=Ancylobacter polymorphus TaxID=223390 RepID=A0ABU0BGP4_9HYPH|nr:DUF1403 family protein [Ancylobacter polymorphus]MDQ0305007.1 hypothetical protein [Ancylobacter polymorphus]
MASRARLIPEPPPTFPAFPGWARPPASGEALEDTGFLAGAALAALHPIARHEHPLGILWRQRLALSCAAALAQQNGRTEAEAALRDHWYLRRDGDDPGPAGQLLKAWRALSERSAMAAGDWELKLAALLAHRYDDALQDVIAFATDQLKGQGSAVRAAAAVAATSLRLRPDSRPLALWLADAVLAHRLRWPAPVPLLAAHLRRADFRHAAARADGHSAWLAACSLAYARGAATAANLHADLARRAERLLAAAPQLRGRDADMMVAILLSEDAQPAKTGKAASDRSSRRLFERLVALGGVRELTGRPTFRLYGL